MIRFRPRRIIAIILGHIMRRISSGFVAPVMPTRKPSREKHHESEIDRAVQFFGGVACSDVGVRQLSLLTCHD